MGKTLFAVCVSGLVATGCDAGSLRGPCVDIPEGGCPSQEGIACQDPTCAAAYTCQADGGWALAYVCPPVDASASDVREDTAPSDTGYDIDAPPGSFGGPGCLDLELPDCPLGEALLCSMSSCCGCQDLYVCADGGWNPWGVCTDAGPQMQ